MPGTVDWPGGKQECWSGHTLGTSLTQGVRQGEERVGLLSLLGVMCSKAEPTPVVAGWVGDFCPTTVEVP